jgi:hypothetical protein
MKAARVPMLSLLCLLGCAHKPPTTSGAERKRVPINSAEQSAHLAFCADLGLATAIPGEAPSSAPVMPVVMELHTPTSMPACPEPPRASSYVMRVAPVAKSSAFKPSPEQVSELAPYLRDAERIEVRAPGMGVDEKLAWSRGQAARDFLLKQGVPTGRIWLQVSAPAPASTQGEEGTAIGVEIEVPGGGR